MGGREGAGRPWRGDSLFCPCAPRRAPRTRARRPGGLCAHPLPRAWAGQTMPRARSEGQCPACTRGPGLPLVSSSPRLLGPFHQWARLKTQTPFARDSHKLDPNLLLPWTGGLESGTRSHEPRPQAQASALTEGRYNSTATPSRALKTVV